MYTICNYNTYSAGMKERCRDGCRTSLLIAGVVLVPAIFHTLLPPCRDTLEGIGRDRKLYDEAMRKGYVESALPLVLFVGVTGSGKTLFKRLLLGQSVPEFSPSTPLTEPAVRTTGNEEWKVVGPKEMMDMVADAVKGKVSLLDSTDDLCQIAFTGPQEHSQQLKTTPTPQMKQEKKDSDPVVHVQPQTKVNDSTPKSVTGVQPQDIVPQLNTYKKTIQVALKEIEIDSSLLKIMKEPPKDIVGKLMDVDFLYLLDSGGQPPFREMLPHFVQKAAATVLMLKLNERLDFRPTIRYREKEEDEDIGYESELTNEQILHQYIQAVQSHNSRVFVVGTHMDRENECQSETREMKNEKLLKSFSTVFHGKMELYGNQLIFPVDCTSHGPHSKKIAQIFRTRVIDKCTGERIKIPLSFFMLDQLLMSVSDNMKVKILTIEECYKAAEQKLFMPQEVCELALRHLSKLNIIIYGPNILTKVDPMAIPSSLSKVVFPDPRDVLSMITELVCWSHKLRTKDEAIATTLPCCMQNDEGLSCGDFGQVNANFLEKAFPSYYREGVFSAANFLELLEGLLIAAKLDDGNHFIPSLLPDLSKEKVSEHRVTSSDNPAPLVIHYPKMWLPVGVMPSLVVHLRNDHKWETYKHQHLCLYHNCIKFGLPGGKPGSVALINSTKFLEIHVKSKIDSKLCHRIREDIMAGLEEAHNSLHYDPPEAEIVFLCSQECGNTDEPHLATLDDEKKAWRCSEDDSIGSDLTEREYAWLQEPKDTSRS